MRVDAGCHSVPIVVSVALGSAVIGYVRIAECVWRGGLRLACSCSRNGLAWVCVCGRDELWVSVGVVFCVALKDTEARVSTRVKLLEKLSYFTSAERIFRVSIGEKMIFCGLRKTCWCESKFEADFRLREHSNGGIWKKTNKKKTFFL